MSDFTLTSYSSLLTTLHEQNFTFQTFAQYLQNPQQNSVILRHDVDKQPQNSLEFAKMQAKKGIKGSYYFRILPCSYNELIIKEIAELGHEIGYHYEDLTITNGNVDKAYDSFCSNLEYLRKLYPIETICMHGSPQSKWDSKDIWKKYDYKRLGITGEPYFDVNFDNIFYLTDTGRMWDGWKYSVRDKVPQQEKWFGQGLTYHETNDIIKALKVHSFPKSVMFTFHPQRWTENKLPWFKEFISQNMKNIIKQLLIN